MQNMSVAELALWRDANFAHTLLDVRRAAKRAQDGAQIAGGQWLDPALWLDWKDQVPQDKPVVLYCAFGHEISQGLAATLRAMGADARYLVGGFAAWQEAGQAALALNEP